MTRAEALAVAKLLVPSPLYHEPWLSSPSYQRRRGTGEVWVSTFRMVPNSFERRNIVGNGADWIAALTDLAAKLAADDRRAGA